MPGWDGAAPHIWTTALYRHRTSWTFPAVPSSTSIHLVHTDLLDSIIIPLKQTLTCIQICLVFPEIVFPLTHFIDILSHFHFFVYSFRFSVFNFFFWRWRWNSCWPLTFGPPLLTSWEPRFQVWASMPVYWYCLKTQKLSTTPVHTQISKVMTGIQKILGPPSPPTQLTSNCLSFSVDQNSTNLLLQRIYTYI